MLLKNIHSSLLMVILLLLTNWAAAQQITLEGNTIDEKGYSTFELGSYKKGKKKVLWVAIKNDSDLPMQLDSLELSCDCLSAPALPPIPVPPHAIYRLKIVHNAKYVGDFQTFAILYSNAGNYPKLWIKLNGEVIKKKKK